MRQRITKRRDRKEAKSVLAEIKELEAQMAGDEDLALDTDAIEKEDLAVVQETTPVTVEVGKDQNDKTMNNWPVADQEKIASRLIKMAKDLLDSEEEEE